MRCVKYKRFDGLTETKRGCYGNIREYKESVVTYTWPKNEEIVHRYLTRFFPKLAKALVPPHINEPSFGMWIHDNGEYIQLKTKCCAGISREELYSEYAFSTKTQRKCAC